MRCRLMLNMNLGVYEGTDLLRSFGSTPTMRTLFSTCLACTAYFSVLLEASAVKTLDVLQSATRIKHISEFLASRKK